MDIEKLDINAVCFGVLCNFTPICGKERAEEAVKIIRSIEAENVRLRTELEQVKHQCAEYRVYYDDLSSKPDCNTCTNEGCGYKPRPGDIVRANCPLWCGAKED